jgi:hypothetical protein
MYYIRNVEIWSIITIEKTCKYSECVPEVHFKKIGLVIRMGIKMVAKIKK